jgi:hypothetical protein
VLKVRSEGKSSIITETVIIIDNTGVILLFMLNVVANVFLILLQKTVELTD